MILWDRKNIFLITMKCNALCRKKGTVWNEFLVQKSLTYLFLCMLAFQVLRRGYWSYECKCHQRKCNIQRKERLLSPWIYLSRWQVPCGNNHRTLSSSQIFYIQHLYHQIRTTKCYTIINYISNKCGIMIVIGSLHRMKPQAFNCTVFLQV